MLATELDVFTRAYVQCALWASTDEDEVPLGDGDEWGHSMHLTAEDIAPESLAMMAEDCRCFQSDNAALLAESGLSDEVAGHCFWLNRNGHGTGFWDRGNAPCFQKLSDACKPWGTCDLYVGDDGRVYLM